MERGNRTHERLFALFLLGALLLLPPLLLVFNQPIRILGIPALYLYVFAAWSLIIALSAAIARRIEPDAETNAEDVKPAEVGEGQRHA